MSDESLFSNDWLEIQKKYWDGWTEMSRKAMGIESGDATKPWESALDHWWQALSPATPDAAKEFINGTLAVVGPVGWRKLLGKLAASDVSFLAGLQGR